MIIHAKIFCGSQRLVNDCAQNVRLNQDQELGDEFGVNYKFRRNREMDSIAWHNAAEEVWCEAMRIQIARNLRNFSI